MKWERSDRHKCATSCRKEQIIVKNILRYLVIAMALTILPVCMQNSSQAKSKIYNNGSGIVEYKNKLYYNQSGNQQGVYVYDLKTKKKKKIIPFEQFEIWIADEQIFCQNENVLYSVSVNDGKSTELYKSDEYFSISGLNSSQRKIYLQEGYKFKELDFNGTVVGEQTITSPASFSGGVFGNTVLFDNETTVYYGKNLKSVKKLATVKKGSISDPHIDLLGIYGNYAYGYIYEKPGTLNEQDGFVFQISLKSGKVKIQKDMCVLNNCLLVSGKIYAEKLTKNGKTKTICYQLSKKGNVKKKVYNCSSLGTADKRYIYTVNNNKNKKAISRFDTKTKKSKVLDSRYKKKNKIYYGSRMFLINGKLFFSGEYCLSGKTVGWRTIPDYYMYYYMSPGKGKRVNYAKSET